MYLQNVFTGFCFQSDLYLQFVFTICIYKKIEKNLVWDKLATNKLATINSQPKNDKLATFFIRFCCEFIVFWLRVYRCEFIGCEFIPYRVFSQISKVYKSIGYQKIFKKTSKLYKNRFFRTFFEIYMLKLWSQTIPRLFFTLYSVFRPISLACKSVGYK